MLAAKKTTESTTKEANSFDYAALVTQILASPTKRAEIIKRVEEEQRKPDPVLDREIEGLRRSEQITIADLKVRMNARD